MAKKKLKTGSVVWAIYDDTQLQKGVIEECGVMYSVGFDGFSYKCFRENVFHESERKMALERYMTCLDCHITVCQLYLDDARKEVALCD